MLQDIKNACDRNSDRDFYDLDFIINYDIKYMMGKELENGDEEE